LAGDALAALEDFDSRLGHAHRPGCARAGMVPSSSAR
jgi:hypothetical protein